MGSSIPKNFCDHSSHDHLVEFFESEKKLCQSVIRFASTGLYAGEGVIIIAAEPILSALKAGLSQMGFDHAQARMSGQLVILNAHDTLARFMVNGLPDENLFNELIREVIDN